MKKILLSIIFMAVLAYTATSQNYQWANRMGGSGYDECKSIAIDVSGNLYMTGRFHGTVDFDPSNNTANLTAMSIYGDNVLTKYDASGNYIWAKRIGGTNASIESNSITIDASGNLYLTGVFGGTVDFDPSGNTVNLTDGGQGDIFIAKYDDLGNYMWAKRIGNFSLDYGNSIASDALGNVYVTGRFWGTVDFDPSPNTANLTAAGNGDIFIAKYDSLGNYAWAIGMGSSASPDEGYTIVPDALGNVYVTGHFFSIVDFDPSGNTVNLTGGGVFIAKYDTSGNYIWAKNIGGFTAGTEGSTLALDASGNVYVTGGFYGTVNFDPLDSTANLTAAGNNDIFIAKYDAQGNYIWANGIGGSAASGYGNSTVTDTSGNVFLTGYFSGTADFDPSSNTANLTAAAGDDIIIAKYDASGNYVWAINMGGLSGEEGSSIALDASGNVYIAGYFNSIADFDPSTNTANLSSAGDRDIFIAKYHDATATSVQSFNNASNSFVVYPNPGNKINFSVQTNVQLTNITGQIIVYKKNVKSLDISEQPAGIYFVTFTDDNGKVLQCTKIVKK